MTMDALVIRSGHVIDGTGSPGRDADVSLLDGRTLPRAVLKVTGGAAAALGLAGRGVLREGYTADIVVFDPARIADCASYDDPHQYATGVSTVIVHGEVVVDGGNHTGALPGRVLRRQAHRHPRHGRRELR